MKISKYTDWLITLIGYAVVLIAVSLVFNDTVYVEIKDDEVFGIYKKGLTWYKKENFYDLLESSLMMCQFSPITKEEVIELISKWFQEYDEPTVFVRFKELRLEYRLSQEELAGKLGIHVDIVKSIENGYAAPIKVLKMYALFFNVSSDYILELKNDR